MGVRVREVNGAWWIFINHQGRRKAKRVGTGPAGKKAATTAAAKIAAALTLGDLKMFEEAKAVPTVEAVAQDWFRTQAPGWKGSTPLVYQSIIKSKIIPAFGSLPISDLTGNRLEAWWTKTREAGYAKKTLSNFRSVIRGICQRAMTLEYLTKDPSLRIQGRLGRQDRELSKVDWLVEDDLLAMLASAERICPRGYPLLLTMGTAGLRLGETLTLQVGDLDVSGRRVHVRRALTRGGRISSPKNGKGRVVDVPVKTMAVLAHVAAIRQAEAAVAGTEARWLFPGNVTGRCLENTTVRRWLQKALRAAGVRRVRIHDLRHTYATLALLAGVPLLTVSRQLGHSSIAVTADIYAHAIVGGNRAAAEAMEKVLARETQADARPPQVG